jgi:hypothetical protein
MLLKSNLFYTIGNILKRKYWRWFCIFNLRLKTKSDAPPSSLIGSTMNSRWKQRKDKELGVRSFIRNTSGVEGRVGAPGWGLQRVTNRSIIYMNLHNQTISWLMHSWNIFGAQMNHGQTQTHKIHHSPNLRETNTFPLIVFFVPSHRACTQISFCPKLPSWSLEIP